MERKKENNDIMATASKTKRITKKRVVKRKPTSKGIKGWIKIKDTRKNFNIHTFPKGTREAGIYSIEIWRSNNHTIRLERDYNPSNSKSIYNVYISQNGNNLVIYNRNFKNKKRADKIASDFMRLHDGRKIKGWKVSYNTKKSKKCLGSFTTKNAPQGTPQIHRYARDNIVKGNVKEEDILIDIYPIY